MPELQVVMLSGGSGTRLWPLSREAYPKQFLPLAGDDTMVQATWRRVEAIVEVETGESVNHLEALAEWAHYSKGRTPFHLYVPSTMVDVARRLCEDNRIAVNEIWSFHGIGDDVRFTLVHRTREAAPVAGQRVHLDPPAQERTRAVLEEARQARHVGGALLGRHDRLRDAAARHLRGAPAEELLGEVVPPGDAALVVDRDEGLAGGTSSPSY